MYRYTMYRDRIELNASINDIIKKELLKDAVKDHPKRTVLLAAREIWCGQGVVFELSDCDLVLVADKLDTSKGTIKINVTDGAASGQPGLPGRKVTVVCKEVVGIRFQLKGRTGAPGASGLPSAPGKHGMPIWTEKNGDPGDKGGEGQPGYKGGVGGTLSMIFMKCNANLINISLPGGDGGQGGAGGVGGPGGIGVIATKPNGTNPVRSSDGPPGPKGEDGKVGETGMTGTNNNTLVASEDVFWQNVRSLFTPDVEWGAYRLKIGEYFFRAYNASNPGYLNMALNEFNAVLFLNPGSTQAT